MSWLEKTRAAAAAASAVAQEKAKLADVAGKLMWEKHAAAAFADAGKKLGEASDLCKAGAQVAGQHAGVALEDAKVKAGVALEGAKAKAGVALEDAKTKAGDAIEDAKARAQAHVDKTLTEEYDHLPEPRNAFVNDLLGPRLPLGTFTGGGAERAHDLADASYGVRWDGAEEVAVGVGKVAPWETIHLEATQQLHVVGTVVRLVAGAGEPPAGRGAT